MRNFKKYDDAVTLSIFSTQQSRNYLVFSLPFVRSAKIVINDK